MNGRKNKGTIQGGAASMFRSCSLKLHSFTGFLPTQTVNEPPGSATWGVFSGNTLCLQVLPQLQVRVGVSIPVIGFITFISYNLKHVYRIYWTRFLPTGFPVPLYPLHCTTLFVSALNQTGTRINDAVNLSVVSNIPSPLLIVSAFLLQAS